MKLSFCLFSAFCGGEQERRKKIRSQMFSKNNDRVKRRKK
ncbi:hypothetical protein RUMHYD_00809 [Blautia hydrogenotrophica DSM 10507]|uniref:Uncharacterized protein n=1 Tax=Blautia hydrogenotrophica (strain DSM 10507 / JCM 14656 / S5a33) TaxID=476272 RepID=C0CIZ2_BLAHS|nr:hypothetical protein RUMHYD_00809 [Blautia hydrogenotrophica DSM 10507]